MLSKFTRMNKYSYYLINENVHIKTAVDFGPVLIIVPLYMYTGIEIKERNSE